MSGTTYGMCDSVEGEFIVVSATYWGLWRRVVATDPSDSFRA